jgi:RNA polymerase sigma-70 factor (ECF subfamily)
VDDWTLNLIGAQIPRLRRAARAMCRDAVLADDLVQECLLRAISRLDTWEPGTNLRAWLLTILRNVFINEWRRIRRTPTMTEYDETQHAAAHAGMQNLAVDLTAVQRAFNRLSDEHREILLLVALEEFSYEEAASVLGLPSGTVRSRLSRARTAMRELMSVTPVETEQRSNVLHLPEINGNHRQGISSYEKQSSTRAPIAGRQTA